MKERYVTLIKLLTSYTAHNVALCDFLHADALPKRRPVGVLRDIWYSLDGTTLTACHEDMDPGEV